MPIGKIDHADFISFCKRDNLRQFYVTTVEDEIINFTSNNNNHSVNALNLKAIDSTLFIAINGNDEILVLEAGESFNSSYTVIKFIEVLGGSGQKIKWQGHKY